MRPRRAQNTSGFTLIELMVVVAIVGVLTSIATANYQKFAARARQSEAKIVLASATSTARTRSAWPQSGFRPSETAEGTI